MEAYAWQAKKKWDLRSGKAILSNTKVLYLIH